MEGDDDRRIGKRLAHRIERFEAEPEDVVEMHNVRIYVANETHEVATDIIGVAVRQIEMIEIVAVEQDVRRALAQAHQRRAGMARRG